MQDIFSLHGRSIVVTGAASGIGKQCALDFAEAGASLILLDINSEELEITARECRKKDNSIFFKTCDLTQSAGLNEIIAEGVAEVGAVNGFLHAAGIEKTLPFNKFSTEDYIRIYSLNVISAMNLISIISKKKFRGESPKYVLISSITSVVGRPGVNAYAASKGALVSATKTLSLELAPKGATINCISPGTILTPLMQNLLNNLDEEQRAERVAGFPLGLGKPSDISATARFLLSDAARWITGQNIIVDGGFTSR